MLNFSATSELPLELEALLIPQNLFIPTIWPTWSYRKPNWAVRKYTMQFLCVISWGTVDLNSTVRETLDGGN